MRDQLLGVLRDVTARAAGAVTRSTPSHLFETPAVAGEDLSWNDLPWLTTAADDPMAAYLASGYQDTIEADRVGGSQAGWN